MRTGFELFTLLKEEFVKEANSPHNVKSWSPLIRSVIFDMYDNRLLNGSETDFLMDAIDGKRKMLGTYENRIAWLDEQIKENNLNNTYDDI